MSKYVTMPGFGMLPEWLLRRREVGPTTKMVLSIMNQLANPDGVYEFAPDEIAKRLGAELEVVLAVIGRLESHGILRPVETGLHITVPSHWLYGPQDPVIPELWEPDELLPSDIEELNARGDPEDRDEDEDEGDEENPP